MIKKVVKRSKTSVKVNNKAQNKANKSKKNKNSKKAKEAGNRVSENVFILLHRAFHKLSLGLGLHEKKITTMYLLNVQNILYNALCITT